MVYFFFYPTITLNSFLIVSSSSGVNMYAMVIGKLPFRSPRQGTKKRQKLLEQITAGITENHENEMSHLSQGKISSLINFHHSSVILYVPEEDPGGLFGSNSERLCYTLYYW